MTTRKETEEPTTEEPYICIDERIGKWIYGYYNETLSVEKTQCVEQHLLLCFRCQETFLTLYSIFEALRANREQLFGPEDASEKRA